MIWSIDEYLGTFLRGLKLCLGIDIDIDFWPSEEDQITVAIFWVPDDGRKIWLLGDEKIPVCQIEFNGEEIFRRQGTEDPEQWGDLMAAAADALAAAQKKGE